jgi:DNA (cytosine-5)-methyltransferase 1
VVRDTQPKVLLFENVSGLAYKGKDEGLGRVLNGLKQINRETGTRYEPHWQVIDAANYGVPQHRERVFIVASRDGREFKFPLPTHGNIEDLFNPSRLEPYRTTWDALGDLPQRLNDPTLRMSGKWADLLASIPEGENYLWHTPRGRGRPLFGWRTRYWSFLLKLAKNRPSWTIQAQPGSATGPFHWTNRKLSPQEMCRLQTFPEGLEFDCSRTDLQRMLGNAVPSLVAEVLAREIRAQLLDSPARSKRLKLLPPRRKNVPAPERAAKVPRKFLQLEGAHLEHPGEGRGNRAKARLHLAA